MGETEKRALRMEFDRKVKLEFHGAKITSDAGLLAYQIRRFGVTDSGSGLAL